MGLHLHSASPLQEPQRGHRRNSSHPSKTRRCRFLSPNDSLLVPAAKVCKPSSPTPPSNPESTQTPPSHPACAPPPTAPGKRSPPAEPHHAAPESKETPAC